MERAEGFRCGYSSKGEEETEALEINIHRGGIVVSVALYSLGLWGLLVCCTHHIYLHPSVYFLITCTRTPRIFWDVIMSGSKIKSRPMVAPQQPIRVRGCEERRFFHISCISWCDPQLIPASPPFLFHIKRERAVSGSTSSINSCLSFTSNVLVYSLLPPRWTAGKTVFTSLSSANMSSSPNCASSHSPVSSWVPLSPSSYAFLNGEVPDPWASRPPTY